MAKSTKKPNSFSKGMMSDLDANVLLPDSYRSATNGRLMSREDNSFTLKSAEGNSLFAQATFSIYNVAVVYGALNASGYVSTSAISLTYDSVSYSYTYTNTDFESDIDTAKLLIDTLNGFISTHGASTPTLSYSIVKGIIVITNTGSTSLFNPTSVAVSATQLINTVPTPWSTSTTATSIGSSTYSSVGITSFSNYAILLCVSGSVSDDYKDVILKYTINDNGTVSGSEIILIGDFGFSSSTSIRIEKSEENEHYHRIYWTDGVAPLRTLNLKEAQSYYSSITVDDLDVFKASNLLALNVDSIEGGGSVPCGSHSYCYRLSTGDGKESMVSAITNPIPIYRSSKSNNVHEIHGGGAGVDSGKSVSMSISGLDNSYTTIEIIDISYTSKAGGISANIISEGILVGGSFRFTHSGSEVKIPITVGELLKSSVSWVTCKDIAIKDNRLFATNLSNDFADIDYDFRLRYYKLSGSAFTESASHINENIHHEDFYTGSYFNSIEHATNTTTPVFGAQSKDYNTSDTGVRVTFKLKRFDLTSMRYYENTEESSSSISQRYSNPPYYGPKNKSGDDSFYDNYQNPLFSSKYTGYQRGEVYRFGLLFYDVRGIPMFVKPIGDIRFPDATTPYTYLDESDNVIAPTSGLPTMFQTSDYLGNGYVLYPSFDIKLSSGIRRGISGYSIVRLDRTDSDKRIVASGLFNQTMLYSDVDENKGMKDYIGNEYLNIYSSVDTHASMSRRLFTFDTPESSFSFLSYKQKSGDKINISSVLSSFVVYEDNLPGYPSNQATETVTKVHGGQTHAGAKFNPMVEGNDDDNTLEFSIYTQCYQSIGALPSGVDKTKSIYYGTTVAPKEVVSSSSINLGSNNSNFLSKDYRNGCRFTTGSLTYSLGNGTTADLRRFVYSHPFGTTSTSFDSESNQGNGTAYTLYGNNTILLSLGEDLPVSDFTGTSSVKVNYMTDVTNTPNSGTFSIARKLYGNIVRDVSDVQYGGSTNYAYETAKYISTGHYKANPSSVESNDIYGGDTFINSYSLRKQYASYKSESHFSLPSTAIIFPVESSVNLDMRDGIYFGSTTDINSKIEDSYLYNQTYSCRNTNKTYVPKPFEFKNVSQFPNLVAASNVKIPGESGDSYTSFGANEIHELDLSKGPIYNIFNLRGDLFVLQASGVSKLSINPRVIVDNSDAAATSITTGTGLVIERSDYIDTMYGSQHYNNVGVTSNSAYWFDAASSSFCRLAYGKGLIVQDLGLTTQNANVFDSLKDLAIGDEPLNHNTGGVNVYYDKRHDEIGISISNTAKNVHMVYSELTDVMVSHKFTVVVGSVNLSGELYTLGYNDFDGTGSLDSSKIWLENSSSNHSNFYGIEATNSLDVEFVCNENVFSSKKFDKLTMYLSGNANASKFTKFTFTDSLGNELNNDATISRMSNGKHITPIVNTDGSGKAVGNYLIIKAESTNTGELEVFGALIHNRVEI